jgi:hypothetical protein
MDVPAALPEKASPTGKMQKTRPGPMEKILRLSSIWRHNGS